MNHIFGHLSWLETCENFSNNHFSNMMSSSSFIFISPLATIVISSLLVSIFLITVLPFSLTLLSLTPLMFIYTHRTSPSTYDYILVIILVFIDIFCAAVVLFPLLKMGRYFLLTSYLPVIFAAMYYRYVGPVSRRLELVQYLIWDAPIMLWMYVISLFGLRAMRVSHIYISSRYWWPILIIIIRRMRLLPLYNYNEWPLK